MGIREIFGQGKAKNDNNTCERYSAARDVYAGHAQSSSTAIPSHGRSVSSSSPRHYYNTNAKSVNRGDISRSVVQGHSYDAAVAGALPVTGSYPVAGNGPNMLGEIQRTRAKRESIQSSTPRRSVSRTSFSLFKRHSISNSNVGGLLQPPSDIDTAEKPWTAPNDRVPGRNIRRASDSGRTHSEGSMRTARDSQNPRRTDSVRSNISSGCVNSSTIPTPLHPPAPLRSSPQISTPSSSLIAQRRVRRISTNPPPQAIPEGFAQASTKQLSRKGHVDLFDAHSNIKQTREESQHREEASGMRGYGEDVADRNIIAYLDLNSPEFGYLKSIYGSHGLAGNTSTASLVNRRSDAAKPVPMPVGVGLAASGTTRDHFTAKNGGCHNVSGYSRHSRAVNRGTTPIRHGSEGALKRQTPVRPSVTTDDTFKMRPFILQASFPAAAGQACSNGSTVPRVPTTYTPTYTPTYTTSPRSVTSDIIKVSRTSPAPHSPTRPKSNATCWGSTTVDAAETSGPRASFPTRPDSATSRSYSANRGCDDDGASYPHHSLAVHARTIAKEQTFRSGSEQSPVSIEEEPFLVNSTASTPTSPSFSPTNCSFHKSSLKHPPSRPTQEQPYSFSSHDQLAATTESPRSSSAWSAPLSSRPSTSSSHSRQTSNTSVARSPYWYRRSYSMSSQGNVVGGSSHRRGSSNGSGSHSKYPSPSSQTQHAQGPRENIHDHQRRDTHRDNLNIVKDSSEPISLEGIVDLTNTVDTTVTTRYLPAVTHETVIPTEREVREEVITREIHTHDVFHRILPVIETVVLPTKHYVPTLDGKGLREIPEHMIPGRTSHDSPSRNWEIVQTGMGGRGDSIWSSATHNSHNQQHQSSSMSPHSRVVGGTSELEPVLTSKKTYMTKHGYPRTEYVWRHPPVFETANGQTQYIFQGVERYLNGEQRHGHVRSASEAGHSPRNDGKMSRKFDENNLRSKFNRDSGYHDEGHHHDGHLDRSHDMSDSPTRNHHASIPEPRGMDSRNSAQHSPLHQSHQTHNRVVSGSGPVGPINHGNGVQATSFTGEATSALKRIREKRSRASSVTSSSSPNGIPANFDHTAKGNFVADVERGMQNLNRNH